MMEQLLAHLFGDYVLQSDWMALNKKKPGWRGEVACLMHAWSYTIPFVLLTNSVQALFIIGFTHFIIDRGYLAPWLTWLKNFMALRWLPACDCDEETECNKCGTLITNRTWKECKTNFGFDPSRPFSVVFPVSVVIDNTLHLLINYGALRWLQ
jgi:hypothetical protein